MMKRFFRSWPAVSISVLLLALAVRSIVLACAGGDLDGTEASSFAPETFVDKPYTPFFFSDNFYYDIYYDTEHDTRFSEDNVREWTAFIGGDAGMARLVHYVLNGAGQDTVDALVAYALNASASLPAIPDTVVSKKELASFRSDKLVSFLQYASLARRCEAFAVNGSGYWEAPKPVPAVKELGNLEAKLTEGLQQAVNAKNNFLQQRYWFQLVRYYFFYDLDKAVKLFTLYAGGFPKNHTYYRTMAYAAGALYKQRRYAESNYYYSLVFAGDDKLKTVAHWSFHPQEEADWQQTLALCQSPEEQATCWLMLGTFYDDELRSMKEMYRLVPANSKLDLLLTRMINKQEYDATYSYRDSFKRPDLNEAYQWVRQAADAGKVSNSFLWHAGAGYLAFLKEEYTVAKKYYANARKYKPAGQLAEQQLRLLELLAGTGELKHISQSDEARLLPELKWLFEELPKNAVEELRYSHATDWIRQRMAKAYEAQGDIAKAECYVHHTAYYGDTAKVQAIQAFLRRDYPINSYEALCRSLSSISAMDIDEMKAIKAAFTDDLPAAVALMRNVAEPTELYGNPFNARINDCHDCDHAAPQQVKYDKLSFLEKMSGMQAKLKAGDDVFSNAILLGNAFYNMSFYGNARAFASSDIIEIGYDPYSVHEIFRPMLLSNTMAEKYYKMALRNVTTDEQRAKSSYLLAKCERNGWYTKLIYNNEEYKDSYDRDWEKKLDAAIRRTWFAQLTKYSQTRYYQEVIRECGYFRNYLGR